MRIYRRWRRFKPYWYRQYTIRVAWISFTMYYCWYTLYITFYGLSIGWVSITFSGWFSNCGYYRVLTYLFVWVFWYFFNKAARWLYRYTTRLNFMCLAFWRHGYYSWPLCYFYTWALVLYLLIDPVGASYFILFFFFIVSLCVAFVIYHYTRIFIINPLTEVKNAWVTELTRIWGEFVEFTAKLEYPINYLGYDYLDSSSFLFELTMLV